MPSSSAGNSSSCSNRLSVCKQVKCAHLCTVVGLIDHSGIVHPPSDTIADRPGSLARNRNSVFGSVLFNDSLCIHPAPACAVEATTCSIGCDTDNWHASGFPCCMSRSPASKGFARRPAPNSFSHKTFAAISRRLLQQPVLRRPMSNLLFAPSCPVLRFTKQTKWLLRRSTGTCHQASHSQWPHAPNSRWSCSFPRLTSCETCSTPSDTHTKVRRSHPRVVTSAEGLYEVCERANQEGSHAKPATSQLQHGTGQVLSGSFLVFLDRTNRADLSLLPGRQFGVANGDRN